MNPLTINIIAYLSTYSPLLPLIAGFKQRKNILWGFLLFSLLADLTLSYIINPLKINRYWFTNTYVLVEIIAVTLYVTTQLNTTLRKRVLLMLGLLAAGYIGHTLLYNTPWVFNGAGSSVISLFGICICIFGLYNMLREQRVMHLETSGYFWGNVAFIIYFSGNFMLYLFISYLEVENRKSLNYLWPLIHNNLNILHRILLTVALTRKNP